MKGTRSDPVAAVEQELEHARLRARELAESVDDARFGRRPAPDRWSIAECLTHLNLTSQIYLPVIRQTIDTAPASRSGRSRRDLAGWLLCRVLEPPARFRAKTKAAFTPSRTEPKEAVLADFDRLQAEVLAAVRATDERGAGGARMTSPFDARLKYNLYSCFKVLAAHQRRHLWQAEQVRQELERSPESPQSPGTPRTCAFARMKALGRILLWAVALLAGALAAALLVSSLVYSPEYVLRIVRWRDADVYDHRRFPARPLAASPAPFRFVEAADEARVRAAFESHPEIDELEAFLAGTGTHAFLVLQDDRILYERYFNGGGRDSIVTSFSLAKSFTSALVGIAIAEGRIGRVDDPITKYLPELMARDPRFGEITIRHLLRMSSGIRYVEYPFFTADDAKTYYYPDLRHAALRFTHIAGPPGRSFLYNNYHPLLLGMILERATGMSVTAYLQEKIWAPLGMEYDGSWSLDGGAPGFEKMESGLNARAIDFAKFGRLFLNGGRWNGRQVVPAEWVGESTREDPSVDRAAFYPDWALFTTMGGYYGYMWWGVRRGDDGCDFYGVGNHGQYVYVALHKRLILVRHGERYGVPSLQWIRAFYRFATDYDAPPAAP